MLNRAHKTTVQRVQTWAEKNSNIPTTTTTTTSATNTLIAKPPTNPMYFPTSSSTTNPLAATAGGGSSTSSSDIEIVDSQTLQPVVMTNHSNSSSDSKINSQEAKSKFSMVTFGDPQSLLYQQ